ncbi:MAG TPA: YIP1 family protein [Gemmatimonadaceae bacterium]|nr:YIP1 family protein [Gemmatimonadaceae bacterium]
MTSSTPPTPSAEGAPAEKPVSRWEDLVDIFVSPAELFERRKNSSPWFPLIVAAVVSFALFLATRPLLQPIYDVMGDKMMAAAQQAGRQVTPEQMERGRTIGTWIAAASQLVVIPITIAITGFVLWIVGKLVDARESLGAAIMVCAFAFFPRLLSWVALGIEGVLMDISHATLISIGFSAARFAGTGTSPVVLALLSRVDLFIIWTTILLAIGLSITGRISRGRAAIAAIVVWLLGAIPPMFTALSGRSPM